MYEETFHCADYERKKMVCFTLPGIGERNNRFLNFFKLIWGKKALQVDTPAGLFATVYLEIRSGKWWSDSTGEWFGMLGRRISRQVD